MKKFTMILFMVVLIGVSGCSQSDKAATSTNTPTMTPKTPVVAEETMKPDAKETPKTTAETEEVEGIIIKTSTVQGTFVENSDKYPTTITFNEDGSFDSLVNICSGMLEVKGEYSKVGNTVTLTIPEETGIYYLDNDQPFEFTITETALTNKSSNTMSCVDTGSYSPK